MSNHYIVGVAYGQKKKTIEYRWYEGLGRAKEKAKELKTLTKQPVFILQEVKLKENEDE